ncbi:hypothetical protein [Natronorarus salvus]|uniref:hypothetical protein n=1 Tax=Natronorarus salvus TaxID=3117733 RepID=UPI002F26DCE9
MNRRIFMVGVAAATVPLSGCSTDESQATGLGSIVVSNDRGEPAEIHLRVSEDGEDVHDERYTLDPGPGDDLSLSEEWMGDGEYEITLGLVDGNGERTVSTGEFEETVSEWDDDCYHLRFVVGSGGGVAEYVRGGECLGS